MVFVDNTSCQIKAKNSTYKHIVAVDFNFVWLWKSPQSSENLGAKYLPPSHCNQCMQANKVQQSKAS